MSSTQELQQCIALTEDGERCSRPAKDGDFCYQHDESYETIDDHEAAEQDEESDSEDEQREQKMPENEQESREQQMEAEQESPPEEAAGEADESEGESIQITARSKSEESEQEEEMATTEAEFTEIDIGQVRENVSNVASDIVGYPLDGIASISMDDEGLEVAIEVIERKGIPDTQDIIGRYELMFDGEMEVREYRRTHRYRRDDMNHDI